MLGKTAAGLYWMQRYLERSENLARLVDAGFRIALTRQESAADEWMSVLNTTGSREDYFKRHDEVEGSLVIDFLLRDKENPSSVRSVIAAARSNARTVRTALTREVFEAINESWMTLNDLLARPVSEGNLPDALTTIRQQSALVRGAQYGTMLRNDGFYFAELGTFVERADNTARILDVKYYVLLPSVSFVGTSMDNVQWETILRSVSAHRAYRWSSGGTLSAAGIAEFVICYTGMPRSLAFCRARISECLTEISRLYGEESPAQARAVALDMELAGKTVDNLFEEGLHEFIEAFIEDNADLAAQIEQDYRFSA